MIRHWLDVLVVIIEFLHWEAILFWTMIRVLTNLKFLIILFWWNCRRTLTKCLLNCYLLVFCSFFLLLCDCLLGTLVSFCLFWCLWLVSFLIKEFSVACRNGLGGSKLYFKALNYHLLASTSSIRILCLHSSHLLTESLECLKCFSGFHPLCIYVHKFCCICI